MKKLFLSIILFSSFLFSDLANLSLELARVNKVDKVLDRVNKLHSLIQNYMLSKATTSVTKNDLQTTFNVPNSTFIGYSGELGFSVDSNKVKYTNVFPTTISNFLKQYLDKSPKITKKSIVNRNDLSISIYLDDKTLSFKNQLNTVSSNSNVSLTPPSDKTKPWYMPDGKGNFIIKIWSTVENKWILQGKDSKEATNPNQALVATNQNDLNSLPATKGQVAYVKNTTTAMKYVYDGTTWTSSSASGDSGLKINTNQCTAQTQGTVKYSYENKCSQFCKKQEDNTYQWECFSNITDGAVITGIEYVEKDDWAMSFDGVDDYIHAGLGSDNIINKAYSISFELQTLDSSGDDFISIGDTRATDNHIHIGFRGDRIYFGQYNDDMSVDYLRNSKNNLLTFVHTSNHTGIIYLNGEEIKKSTFSDFYRGTDDLFLAMYKASSAKANIILDNVQIYNKALTEDEVKQLSLNPEPLTLNPSELVAYYPFNNENPYEDKSGNGHHGTPSGNPTQVYQGKAGAITITGKTTAPNEKVIILEDGTQIATTTSDSQANFQVTIPKTYTISKTYNFQAKTTKSTSKKSFLVIGDKIGKGVEFDNTNHIDTGFLLGNVSKSISFWALSYLDMDIGNHMMLGNGELTSTNRFYAGVQNGKMWLGIGNQYIGIESNILNKDANISNHYVMSFNGTKLDVYQNGVFIASINGTDTSGTIYIGAASGGYTEYFSGIISNVQIYNKALTDDEVKQLHLNPEPLTLNPDGLVAHYNFEGDSPYNDKSGNNHHGTPSGNPTIVDFGNAPQVDDINGSNQPDFISAKALNDTITIYGGNDIVDGGTGYDTVVLSGSVTDYNVTANKGNSFTVIDTRPNSPEGTNILRNVENLFFKAENKSYFIYGLAKPYIYASCKEIKEYGADNGGGYNTNNTLIGTTIDDDITSQPTNDEIVGLEGYDTITLSGSPSDYTITRTYDDRFVIQDNRTPTQNGRDILTAMENVHFSATNEEFFLYGLAQPNWEKPLPGDGIYTIKPEDEEFKVYCDMSNSSNMIINGTFENGTGIPGESDSHGSNEIIEYQNPTSYVKYVLRQSRRTEYQINAPLSLKTQLQPSTNYIFGAWIAYTNDYDGSKQTFHSRWWDANGNPKTTSGDGTVKKTKVIGDLTWEYRELGWTTSTTLNGNFNWYIGYPTHSSGSGNGYRYVTDITLRPYKKYGVPVQMLKDD
jgi:hypothetical protein